jgi:hypothetical protein
MKQVGENGGRKEKVIYSLVLLLFGEKWNTTFHIVTVISQK